MVLGERIHPAEESIHSVGGRSHRGEESTGIAGVHTEI